MESYSVLFLITLTPSQSPNAAANQLDILFVATSALDANMSALSV